MLEQAAHCKTITKGRATATMAPKVFTYEEAFNKSKDYFNGDDLAATVFLSKYALKDAEGNLLEATPDQMHRRLAKEFARIEAKYPNPMSEDEIFGLFDKFKYVVPQGSPMSAIGNPYKKQSLSNCFVIPAPEDSYGGICFTDQQEAQLMKRRGGVGFDVSTLRPKGQPTDNAAVTTDGIGVFLERFSNTCREVAQGGRRGALMITIDIRHPEIENFVTIKRDLKKVTGANMSVKLTDDFMNAVLANDDFQLQWPVDSKNPEITRTIKAQDLWNLIIDCAWENAEPGLLFWDTVTRETPADAVPGFESVSTNPCGEIVLAEYDACRLMLLNVTSYVNNPFTVEATFDYDKFTHHVGLSQRLMDDLIDLEIEAIDRILLKIQSDPQPAHVKDIEAHLWRRIKQMNQLGRRTGLGLTGIGDAIAALGFTYGDKASIRFVEDTYKELAVQANFSSMELGKGRGAFPAHKPGVWKGHPFLERVLAVDGTAPEFHRVGRRNICLTTTAPAGSVSVLTQTTSGIEPAYMLEYTRRKKINPDDPDATVDFTDDMGDQWQEYPVYHHGFKKWMEVTGKTKVEDSPYYKATATEIDWEASVDLQAAAQKWVEHSISKTCNLPADATKELVSSVYLRAWQKGCKGFTVYREGCRSGVLVSEPQKTAQFVQHNAPKRPEELPCKITHATVQKDGVKQKWIILVGMLEGKPYEVFGGLSEMVEIPTRYTEGVIVKHVRKTTNAVYDLILGEDDDRLALKNIGVLFDNPDNSMVTRLLSYGLRHGAPVQYAVEQLLKEKDASMSTYCKAVSRVLKEFIPNGTKTSAVKVCNNCGAESLSYQEGCITCTACGWSKCS